MAERVIERHVDEVEHVTGRVGERPLGSVAREDAHVGLGGGLEAKVNEGAAELLPDRGRLRVRVPFVGLFARRLPAQVFSIV